jgi:hypothetical protein
MIVRTALSLVLALALVPAVAAPQDATEEVTAYSSWLAASQAKDAEKALGLANDYLTKFPKGQYAQYLTKWVTATRGALFNQAIASKNVGAMLKLGREHLAAHPDDLDYVLALALNLRRLELFASPPVETHAKDTNELSQKAIALIEAGKLPTGASAATWPKNATLAWLTQNVAIVAARQQKTDAALAALAKSSSLDPKNASLGSYNALLCGTLRKSRYDAPVATFKALPEAERGATLSANAKAALDDANAQADAAVDCWARFLALSDGQPAFASLRGKIEKTAGELYAYRHPDQPDGLSALVAHQKGGGSQ